MKYRVIQFGAEGPSDLSKAVMDREEPKDSPIILAIVVAFVIFGSLGWLLWQMR